MSNIHPTAVVDPSAQLADDVEIGPYAVVEADTAIGAGTVLRPHSIIRRYTTLGEGNVVDSFVVLGGEPQDLKFDPAQVSYLRIGDNNIFREGVTISRATGEGLATSIGSRTMWMANAHAGHNATVGDDVILANAVLLAGHTLIERGCVLAGQAMIHQFCWVGERVMFQGHAATSQHMPPYVIAIRDNEVGSLNSVGLRRAPDLDDTDRDQIKEAFKITYRRSLKPVEALAEMDTHTEWAPAAGRFRDFVRKVLNAEGPYLRGLVPMLDRSQTRGGRRA